MEEGKAGCGPLDPIQDPSWPLMSQVGAQMFSSDRLVVSRCPPFSWLDGHQHSVLCVVRRDWAVAAHCFEDTWPKRSGKKWWLTNRRGNGACAHWESRRWLVFFSVDQCDVHKKCNRFWPLNMDHGHCDQREWIGVHPCFEGSGRDDHVCVCTNH